MNVNDSETKKIKALRREKKKKPKMAVQGRSFKRQLLKLAKGKK